MCTNYDRYITDKDLQRKLKKMNAPLDIDDDITEEELEKLKQKDIRLNSDIMAIKNKKAENKPIIGVVKPPIASHISFGFKMFLSLNINAVITNTISSIVTIVRISIPKLLIRFLETQFIILLSNNFSSCSSSIIWFLFFI